MLDIYSSKYKLLASMIETKFNNGEDWDVIRMCGQNSNENLQNTLNGIAAFSGVDKIDISEWFEVVDRKEKYASYEQIPTHVTFVLPTENKDKFIPSEFKGSCWQSYVKVLKKKKFTDESIDLIRDSSSRILNQMSLNTKESGAIKGLVIGNVQSGKTANMAGLISMAADQGWNFFIVLSGSIENLRKQNQKRLIDDLKTSTNFEIHGIENEEIKSPSTQALSQIHIGDDQHSRYLYVCLKQSNRLGYLLKYLSSDEKSREKLKILIIDDEADQAGINTKKGVTDTIDERTAVNRGIVRLLNNKDSNGKEVATSFQALNYVAYTATPYANVLDEEPGPNSLYPSDFVASLGSPKSYIGPQQIFGLDGQGGMNIINQIPEEELVTFKQLQKGQMVVMPSELKKAVAWFYVCFAMRKVQGSKKPVSMLIHTSQKQDVHMEIKNMLQNWLENIDALDFIDLCREVYNEQTQMFTKEDFEDVYPDYEQGPINNYLPFDEISSTIVEIFNKNIGYIKIDSDEKPIFGEGVHVCIDNCAHYCQEDDEHIRLLYPSSNDENESKVNYTTGFIVIGGATLSRGLTLEGLVSSYFLRTVRQADSLMQMGRWFGYRIGYELLQRIWLTDKTKEKYEFLSNLDYDLKNEMKRLEKNNIPPSIYAITVKSHPQNAFLQLTSKNKMKAATFVSMDFSGVASQTTVFYDDEHILKSNLDNTDIFIKQLQDGEALSDKRYNGSLLWRNVDSKLVINYLSTMEYPCKSSAFFDLKMFKQWFEEMEKKNGLQNWNVAVASIENGVPGKLGGYDIVKVNRSKSSYGNDGCIRIGALRSTKDLYIDVDANSANLRNEDLVNIRKSSSSEFMDVRKNAGLSKTPLLVIYVIDKNSKKREDERSKRVDLNAKEDIVGLLMVIPEDDVKVDCRVGIRLDQSRLEDEEGDIPYED